MSVIAWLQQLAFVGNCAYNGLVVLGTNLKRRFHPSSHFLCAFLISAVLPTCFAQEVGFLDLTKVRPRDSLRRPKASSSLKDRRIGIHSTDHCLDQTNTLGALQATLLSVDRTHYRAGDEPIFEVKVQNVGSTLLEIPFFPHIADLQPSDPGQKFSVKHLAISWVIASREISHGDAWRAPGVGTVMLYGRRDHPKTMVTLKPGEWVRIMDQGQIELGDEILELIRSGVPADHIQLDFNGLFREEILVTANRSAIVDHELCLSKSLGQTIPVELSLP